jgi:hypothetical protein
MLSRLEEFRLEEYEKLPFVEVPFAISARLLANVIEHKSRGWPDFATAAIVILAIAQNQVYKIDKPTTEREVFWSFGGDCLDLFAYKHVESSNA